MKRSLLALILALFTLPAFALEAGQPAPNFESTTIGGKTFKLSDYKGQIVVLEWQSPECPFSLAHYETGSMQHLQKYAKEKRVVWVTINSSGVGKPGNETRQQARDFNRKKKAHPSYVILDPEGKIGHKFEAKTTPHMFVIDKEGNIAYMGALDDKPGAKSASTISKANNYVYAAIEALLAGKVPATQVTAPYGCGIKYAD
jgi:alkyl hydroperoxide reductase subunit AhpC